MCSNSLHGTDVKETGLELAASDLEPFLSFATTLACFQLSPFGG